MDHDGDQDAPRSAMRTLLSQVYNTLGNTTRTVSATSLIFAGWVLDKIRGHYTPAVAEGVHVDEAAPAAEAPPDVYELLRLNQVRISTYIENDREMNIVLDELLALKPFVKTEASAHTLAEGSFMSAATVANSADLELKP